MNRRDLLKFIPVGVVPFLKKKEKPFKVELGTNLAQCIVPGEEIKGLKFKSGICIGVKNYE